LKSAILKLAVAINFAKAGFIDGIYHPRLRSITFGRYNCIKFGSMIDREASAHLFSV